MFRPPILWVSLLLSSLLVLGCGSPPADSTDSAAPAGLECAAGMVECGGECVVPATDPAHCVDCEAPCPDIAACIEGACICPRGMTLCNHACVDTLSDPAHCGACQSACGDRQRCVTGQCACPEGLVECSNDCVALQSSADHCGNCQTACSSVQFCDAGQCNCPTPYQPCDASCVDLASSSQHCGGCDLACAEGHLCVDGQCAGIAGDGDDGCSGQAMGLAIARIALYQAVEVDLVNNGAAIPPSLRAADIVAGRDALVRIFVSLDASWAPREISIRLNLVTGSQTYSLFTKKHISSVSIQSSMDSTVQLSVPASMIGSDTRFAVEAVECSANSQGSLLSPRFPNAGYAALQARETGSLKIALVPISVEGWDPDTSESALSLYRQSLESMYPITEATLTVIDGLSIAADFDWSILLDDLRARRAADAPADDVFYYGLIRPSRILRDYCHGECTTGIGYLSDSLPGHEDFQVASGVGFTDEFSFVTMTHELGHTLGRGHTPCDVAGDENYPYPGGLIGSWGYDRRTGTLYDPADTFDIMGYCTPPWISNYTYQGMLERMALVNGLSSLSAKRMSGQSTAWWVLLQQPGRLRWGTPYPYAKPPVGEAVGARILAADGTELASVTAYSIATSQSTSRTYLVPPPSADWHSVQLEGEGIIAFAH